jgi:hypothetical protein
MPTHDWSPKNATFEIDYKLYHKKTLGSIVGISINGPELVMTWEKSVNSEKFISYLKALRAKYPFTKLLCFFDQLSVHTSVETKPYYE